ncbi:hypothetical protein [Spirosoma rhododendri]|uniref:hypothetical protein n=1 Tax=Spirosoma rhododendri TaxID=2728024 RepID=UPI002FCDDF27
MATSSLDTPVSTVPTQAAPTADPSSVWTSAQKIAFRIALIFFVLVCLPTGGEWFKNLFTLDWLHPHYRDLYDIARFQPNILGRVSWWPVWLGYGEWVFLLLVAVVGGLLWTAVVRQRKAEPANYQTLYYWLRVLVRYRAGIGIIGFGFTKLMPTQLPYPSLGLLNTNFGDLTAQKIYWLSIGIVPWYEVFAGVVEVLAGALLFFRATTFWGRCCCSARWPTSCTSIWRTMGAFMSIVRTSYCWPAFYWPITFPICTTS